MGNTEPRQLIELELEESPATALAGVLGLTVRRVPLIVVAGRDGTAPVVEYLRTRGAVVYQTRSPEGCLRVATAVGPDIVVLQRGFPRRLEALLGQHPASAGAAIVWLQPAPAPGDSRDGRPAHVHPGQPATALARWAEAGSLISPEAGLS